jgi:hypothetical protein
VISGVGGDATGAGREDGGVVARSIEAGLVCNDLQVPDEAKVFSRENGRKWPFLTTQILIFA